MEHLEGLHAADMPGDHWYLAVIGVDPEAAGTGLGGALLQPVLDAADEQGLPCYLETAEADNKAFYKKHGFAVVRQGAEPSSGLDYWTFRREPRCGRGYAEEAVRAVIDHGFGKLDLHRITADVDPRNGPALRLVERLGFRREGLLREHYRQHDEWQDGLLFGLVRREWGNAGPVRPSNPTTTDQ